MVGQRNEPIPTWKIEIKWISYPLGLIGDKTMPAAKVAVKSMTMVEIKNKAKGLGINPGKMNKTDLIHAIQAAEGNTQCYGWSNGHCPNTDCCFMKDCLKTRL
jgi:hypothetical protein